jgi:hypothetical protein
MKKRGLVSPDSGDALALTFAYPPSHLHRFRALGDAGQVSRYHKLTSWTLSWISPNQRKGLLQITEVGGDGCNLRLRQIVRDRLHNS